LPKIPGVNHLDAVRALEKAGFVLVRQGKHIVMSNGGRILTIPCHNPVQRFTLGGIVPMPDSRLSNSASSSDRAMTPNPTINRTRRFML
jgi:predicted RNA binding protein YcfA (HicA-like mRNA interferase family)